jgi:hypothetical protein
MNDLNSMNDPDVSELLKDRQAEAINATLADAFRKDPESEAKTIALRRKLVSRR